MSRRRAAADPDARRARAEDELDRSLRPRRLETSSARTRVKRAARRRRSRPPPRAARRSTTCCSPGRPGLGKTSLAQIVAAELDVPFVQTAGPALERKGDVAAFLTALEPRSVFFVDEIHRLPRALEETFYPAMEDRRLPITVGQGAGARVVTLDLPPFTLIGATTRAGLLTTPLRDRFGIQHRLEHYDAGRPRADRAPLGRRSSSVELDDGGRRGDRARAAAARRASPTGCSSACATSPRCAATGVVTARRRRRGARPARGRRARASTASTARSSRAICEKFGGGPVGLSTLAVAVGEEPDTIEDVYEPYLLQRGLHQAHAARARGDAARLRAPRARAAARDAARCSERVGADAPAARPRRGTPNAADPYATALVPCAEPWLTSSSARTAGTARPRPSAPPASRREAKGCAKCGFAFLFELLDDYYPAPDAAFFVCDQRGPRDRLRPRLLRADRPRGRAR